MKNLFFPILMIASVVLLIDFAFCTRPPKKIDKLLALEVLPRPENYSEDSTAAFDIYHRAEIYAYFFKLDSALLLSLESIDRFSKLTRHTRDSLTWTYLIDAYFNAGYIYGILNKCDSSVVLLQKSLDLCKQIFTEDHLIATKCMIKLGNCYKAYGNYKLAKEYYLKSYEIRVRTLDSLNNFLINANGVMAAYYYSIGDIDRCKIFAYRANALIKRIYEHYFLNNPNMPDELFYKQFLNYHVRPPVVKNMFLSNIPRYYISSNIENARFHLENDEPEKAIYMLAHADTLIRRHEPSNFGLWSELYNTRAAIYIYNNQTDKAVALVDTIKTLLSKNNSNLHRMHLTFSLADFYNLINKPNESLKIINSFLSEKSIANESTILNFNEHKARDLFLNGQFKECIEFTQELLKSKFKLYLRDSVQSASISWNHLTGFEITRIQDFIRPYFQSVLALAKQSGSLARLKQGYQLLKVFDASMYYLQDELYSIKTKSLRLQTFYPFYEDALELCYLLYDQTADEQYAREVFRLSDQVKSFQIKEIINQQNINASGKENRQKQKAEDLQAEINSIRDDLLKTNKLPNRDSLKIFNLTKSLSELSGELALMNENKTSSVPLEKNSFLSIDFPLQELFVKLGAEKTALLDYFVGKEYLYFLLINGQGYKLMREPLKPDSKLLVEKFVQSIKLYSQDNKTDSLKLWGAILYDIVYKPVKPFINSNTLIVVPDDWISYLPFEYLISAKESIQQISLNLTIRYEYASSLAVIKKQPTRAEIDYVGFAPEYADGENVLQRGLDSFITYPVYSDNRSSIGNLLFNGTEIRESAGILDGEAYSGISVNKDVFIKNSSRARILHLAMHAQTDDKHPEYSQLVFKNEQDPSVSESMYAYELARMKLNADLSVLSACNSGSGKFQKGEGVLSLARAFKASGCPNIIMSLWPANDASTKDIVVGFFKHLKAGMGKADALRQSKQDYLNTTTEELKHPYYWAGLVLIGDNEPMHFASTPTPFVLLIIITLLTVVLIYLRSKKRKL